MDELKHAYHIWKHLGWTFFNNKSTCWRCSLISGIRNHSYCQPDRLAKRLCYAWIACISEKYLNSYPSYFNQLLINTDLIKWPQFKQPLFSKFSWWLEYLQPSTFMFVPVDGLNLAAAYNFQQNISEICLVIRGHLT